MASIHVLPPHVADLIAAGEVVERPASVLKELMENAVDAGATAITVEIRDGGMSYIRVTDNGCGIPADEAETAFLRHATSKLQDAKGLEAIGTLGFRGEALAAIAAVSRIDLLTRAQGAQEGLALSLEAGCVTKRNPAGCPVGTTIIVRDLFFNTPARLKFMKTDRAEGQAASAAVLRCALSQPGLSVRYLREGTEEAHSPGDGRLDSAVYALLGRDFAKDLLPVRGDEVQGLIAPPAAARGNRGYEFFFVNGRYVKSALLQAALEQAYKNNLPHGRYPAGLLYLTVPNAAVDVNVHPAKTEVKFLKERSVFDSVYYAVLAALQDNTPAPELELTHKETTQMPASAPEAGAFRRMAAADYVKAAKQAQSGAKKTWSFQPPTGGRPGGLPKTYGLAEPRVPYRSAANREAEIDTALGEKTLETKQMAQKSAAPSETLASEVPAAPEQLQLTLADAAETAQTVSLRVLGEVLQTYIVAEQGEEVLLIDKHAAHERLIFDRLRAAEGAPMAEYLLSPVPVHLGERASAVLEQAPLLESLGFVLEDFGGDTVLIRALPAQCRPADLSPMLEELAETLSSAGTAEQIGLRDSILHSVACKAAIKAGSDSSPQEQRALAEKVAAGEVKYCPHGRPVALRLTRQQLDKAFQRQ